MFEAVRPQAAVDGSAAVGLSSATAVRWQTKCGYFGLSRHLSVSMSLSLATTIVSRNEPPARCTSRAALVMNVRRPEWDEQPVRPIARYALANQATIPMG